MDFYEKVKIHVEKTNTTIDSFIFDVLGGNNNRDSFYGWKRRKVLPRANDALKIAKAMSITVEELIEDKIGIEYVKKIVKNDPKSIQVPERIFPIVECLLLLDDKELRGIRAHVEELAADKKGKNLEKTGTEDPPG